MKKTRGVKTNKIRVMMAAGMALAVLTADESIGTSLKVKEIPLVAYAYVEETVDGTWSSNRVEKFELEAAPCGEIDMGDMNER